VSGVAGAFPEAVSALVRDPAPNASRSWRRYGGVLSGQRFQASVKAALGFVACRYVRTCGRRSGRCRPSRLRAELERLLGADLSARPIRA
jgi:hypothetical protein